MPGDEAAANAVLARKDAKFADAASVRGRLVLCPQGTSAHYTLVQWLRSLGLTEKDVKIRFMPPEQALGAFRGGLGDLLVTWAPYTYAAEKEGCALVATAADVKASLPLVLAYDRLVDLPNGVTVNTGLISGGTSANSVAPWAEARLHLTYRRLGSGLIKGKK